MAPLVNLVNAVLWSIKLNEPSHVNRRRVADVVREFKRRLHVHEAAIAETALPLIPEGALVVTHGRSTTVRAALLHAQRAGRHFRVVCAEGRPSLEGRTMTSELAAYGIPVTLMSDDLALAAIQTAQVVMIGADHLGLDGLVNKVGTYPVVETAYTKQVAAYALCSSEKFLPPAYHPPEHDDPALQHIWERVPAVPADNNGYFDSTPLGSLSGIVTERGVLPCEVIEGWLASIHLHPTLRTYQAISGGEC
jgi:translation initiation factor 2B subunit (eIF-2B alpha/beta/delta family)